MYRDLKGFTLIELMLVVAILTIISLFATSAYSKYSKDVQISHAVQELARIAGEIEMEHLKGTPYNSTEMEEFLKKDANKQIKYKSKVIYDVSFDATKPLNMKMYTLKAEAKDPTYFDKCTPLTIDYLGKRNPEECW